MQKLLRHDSQRKVATTVKTVKPSTGADDVKRLRQANSKTGLEQETLNSSRGPAHQKDRLEPLEYKLLYDKKQRALHLKNLVLQNPEKHACIFRKLLKSSTTLCCSTP